MKTALVILNWNGRKLLEKFLPAVLDHSASQATVYVADNASTDDSVAFVLKNFPQVKIIQNKINGGYAQGYNEALAQLDEDLFLLVNSDVETTSNWLTPLLDAFKDDPNLGAAQPKILDYKNPHYFEYAGAAGGFIDSLGYPYCRGRIFKHLEKDQGQYNDTAQIFWASGACFAIRRKVFWEAGGLDPMFFAHQEEIDLCWRIKGLGYSIKCIGASTVFHVGGATLSSMNPDKTFYNFRNTLYALVKNVPGKKVWFLILLRLLLDGIAGVQFLLERKPKHFIAILRAHFSFYTNLSKFLVKRKKIKKIAHYSSLYSIVYQYFVLNYKHFKQLPKHDLKNC